MQLVAIDPDPAAVCAKAVATVRAGPRCSRAALSPTVWSSPRAARKAVDRLPSTPAECGTTATMDWDDVGPFVNEAYSTS